MKGYVGHIKGRGYFNGIHTTRSEHRRTDAEQKAYLAKHPNTNSVFRWHTTHIAKPVFKRNLSDVNPEFIFNSTDAYEYYVGITKNDEYHIQNRLNISFFDKIVLEEYDKTKREKRVLPSNKRPYYTNGILNLSKKSKKKKVSCGACGTNIYDDEYRMNTTYAVICIHCLSTLGEDIKDAYDKTPEAYKDDWLLARSVDI